MAIRAWVESGIAFLFACVIGSLAEYVVHRLMHLGKILHQVHAKHHQTGEGQGWFKEFCDYFLPGLPILPLGFLYSVPAGVGFALGGTVYAALAAYAHQVQHENPELVFWLRVPVHYTHHHHQMWKHNFGITVSVWDHIFRTYKEVDWLPTKQPFEYPLRSFFQIRWF